MQAPAITEAYGKWASEDDPGELKSCPRCGKVSAVKRIVIPDAQDDAQGNDPAV